MSIALQDGLQFGWVVYVPTCTGEIILLGQVQTRIVILVDQGVVCTYHLTAIRGSWIA